MRTGLAVVAALLALAIVAPTAAALTESTRRPCEDAPQLPGAISQLYDMWNNIYRHYTCDILLKYFDGVAVRGEVLP